MLLGWATTPACLGNTVAGGPSSSAVATAVVQNQELLRLNQILDLTRAIHAQTNSLGGCREPPPTPPPRCRVNERPSLVPAQDEGKINE